MKNLTEAKYSKGQKVWVGGKYDEPDDFVSGWILDPNEPSIRLSNGKKISKNSSEFERKQFVIKTEKPEHKPSSQTREKKPTSPKPSTSTNVMSDAQFNKAVKQIATMSDGEELDYNVAADLAENLYEMPGIKVYLRKQGEIDRNDALEYLTNAISNYA